MRQTCTILVIVLGWLMGLARPSAVPVITNRRLRVHILTLPMYGHYKTIKDIGTHMAQTGHEVSFLLCEQSRQHFEADKLHQRYNISFVSGGACSIYTDNIETMITRLIRDYSLEAMALMFENIKLLNRQMCEPLMKWYESNEAKRPDVIVYDADSFCGADLAEKFGIARVARVGTGLRNILVAGLDVPPNGAGVSIFEMTQYSRRLQALLTLFLGRYIVTPLYMKSVVFGNRQYFGISGTEQRDYTLPFEGWPALYNTHWGFQHPSLLLPNEFLVGHTNNFDEDAAISLNPKLEQWLQSSDVPVVYLSFGTLSTGIPELVSTIAQAAKKTSFRYVWSIPAKNTALLPEELKVSTETLESSQLPPPTAGSLWISGWQPQVAILSHTKVVAFLTHGGMNSIAETLYSQRPLICVGMFNDQLDNCQSAEDHGFAKAMPYLAAAQRTVAETQLFLEEGLLWLTRSSEVKDALRKSWVRNVAAGGTLAAASIIEMTAETGKYGFALNWYNLPWYQRYNVDMIATACGVALITVLGVYMCTSCISRCCCKKPKLKTS